MKFTKFNHEKYPLYQGHANFDRFTPILEHRGPYSTCPSDGDGIMDSFGGKVRGTGTMFNI
jgi:hypothetical protein